MVINDCDVGIQVISLFFGSFIECYYFIILVFRASKSEILKTFQHRSSKSKVNQNQNKPTANIRGDSKRS